MLSGLTGRRPNSNAVTRGGLLSIGLLVALGLSACTTTEGTNALTDVGTFEREVMSETLRGVGMLEREEKDENANRRGPLVMPKSNAALPPPAEKSQQAAGLLPEDSDAVQVDASTVSAAEMSRLRKVRVVDSYSSSGRPLTQAELAKIVGKMQAARVSTDRPLYLPPEEYFTTVKGQDLVCLAKNGELVPVNDPSCPEDIRKALLSGNT